MDNVFDSGISPLTRASDNNPLFKNVTPFTSALADQNPSASSGSSSGVVPSLCLEGGADPSSPLQLEGNMFNFFANMMDRISKLENCVSQMASLMEQSNQLGNDVHQAVRVRSVLAAAQEAVPSLNLMAPKVLPQFQLHLEGVKDSFFTDRQFPPFTVKVAPIENGTSDASNAYTKANDWKVEIALIDGNGRYVNDLLGDDKAKVQYLKDGVAEVSGLRFKKVSSKNGGFYRLEASVASPAETRDVVAKATSGKIIILSCRLFTCRKGSISKLLSSDSVSKMPGIGRSYGQRLTEINIRTIQNLADLPDGPDEAGKTRRQEIMLAVRRDKGIMNETKFVGHIRKAREICSGTAKTAGVKREAGEMEGQMEAPFAKQTKMVFMQQDVDEQIEESKRKLMELSETHIDSFLNPGAMMPLGDYSMERSDMPLGMDMMAPSPVLVGSVFDDVHRGVGGGGGSGGGGGADAAPKGLSTTAKGLKGYPLHIAVLTGQQEVVEKTFKAIRAAGRDLHELNPQQFTPLMMACALGHVNIVEQFVALPTSDGDLGRGGHGGLNALHMAIMGKQAGCVEALLKRPADVGVGLRTVGKWTALMMATVQGCSRIVHMLMDAAPQTAGELAQQATSEGMGLRHLAALSGDLATATLVFEATQVGDMDAGSGTTPSVLHCAAFGGNVEVLQCALDQGLKETAPCLGGWTPLHVCSFRGFHQMIPVLLADAGLDVNARTDQGWTSLSLAAMETTSGTAGECAERLLRHGAVDDGSAIPASMVSVVTANMQCLAVLLRSPASLKEDIQLEGCGVNLTDVESSMSAMEEAV